MHQHAQNIIRLSFSYGYQQVITDDEFYVALLEIFMDQLEVVRS